MCGKVAGRKGARWLGHNREVLGSKGTPIKKRSGLARVSKNQKKNEERPDAAQKSMVATLQNSRAKTGEKKKNLYMTAARDSNKKKIEKKRKPRVWGRKPLKSITRHLGTPTERRQAGQTSTGE